MTEKPERDRDERVKLPLDPEDALKALLAVKPEDEAMPQGKQKSGPVRRPGRS